MLLVQLLYSRYEDLIVVLLKENFTNNRASELLSTKFYILVAGVRVCSYSRSAGNLAARARAIFAESIAISSRNGRECSRARKCFIK